MFKIWQKVRIKSREQMEKEFGLDDDWDIEMEYTSFVKTMKHLCWRTAEIVWVNWKDIWLVNRSNNEETIWYDYSTDMIELVEEDKAEPKRTPTPWEYVEVSDDDIVRHKRKYTVAINDKYHCIGSLSEEDYNEWTTYSTEQRRYIRQLQTKQTHIIEATEEQRKKIKELIA